MGPDPTQAYFWPAVNKRPTWLWPGYFLTRSEEIVFDPKSKKLKNLGFLGEIFKHKHKPKTADPTWPKQQKFDPTGLRSKIFNPDPSLF